MEAWNTDPNPTHSVNSWHVRLTNPKEQGTRSFYDQRFASFSRQRYDYVRGNHNYRWDDDATHKLPVKRHARRPRWHDWTTAMWGHAFPCIALLLGWTGHFVLETTFLVSRYLYNASKFSLCRGIRVYFGHGGTMSSRCRSVMTALAVGMFALAQEGIEVATSASVGFPILSPEQVYQGIRAGSYGAIIDVRTDVDWQTTARLPNSTILSELYASDASLNGCEYCDLVVYGETTLQVEQVLAAFVAAGMKGTLYNGQTVSDYQSAGLELVFGPSQIPACASNNAEESSTYCYANGQATEQTAETLAPSASPVASPTSESDVSAVRGSSDTSWAYRCTLSTVWLSTISVAILAHLCLQ